MTDFIRSLCLVLCVTACGSTAGNVDEEPPAEPSVATPAPAATGLPGLTPSDLIDPAIPSAIAGEDGWDYIRTAEVDLNADDSPERVVIMARVEVIRGQPAWDDGQPWQVYVESSDGRRTDLYLRRLQLGLLDMRVTTSTTGTPTIILIEHLPDQLAIYELHYAGPGDVAAFTVLERSLDPRGELASPRLP